jgi:hypothetical protein
MINEFNQFYKLSINKYSTSEESKNSFRTLIEHLVFVVEVTLKVSNQAFSQTLDVCEFQQQLTTSYRLKLRSEFENN